MDAGALDEILPERRLRPDVKSEAGKSNDGGVGGVSRVARDWTNVSELLARAVVPAPNKVAERTGKDGGGKEAAPRESTAKSDPRVKAVAPGAVLLVGCGGNVEYFEAFGCRSLVPEQTPLGKGMVFDVASLTKVLVTTTLAMQLMESGELAFDRRLSRIFQTFGTHGKESMTIAHLLTHTSGYPPTAPFYKSIARADTMGRSGLMTSRGAAELVYNEIFRARLDNMPGKVTRYSDIGFLLLGHAIETVTGTSLDKLAAKNVFKPLGLKATGYIDLANMRRRGLEPVVDDIVPTARCPWRGRVLCGEVHDDNAWAMGGVAAHAGVFSTAHDVHLFASEMIRCYRGRGTLVSADVIRSFWTRANIDPSSSWAYGWDMPSPHGSSSGRFFPAHSVGHLAFTGCSLWIDPEREIDVVLLTNRIHPSPENQQIREFRPAIHDAVMTALGYAGGA